MAMVRITPVPVTVQWDARSGRPRRMRIGDDEVPVLDVRSVRDASRAYPAARGPYVSFEVVTPRSRLILTYERRLRRWLVEALDPNGAVGRAA